MTITFHPLGPFLLSAAAAFAEDFPGTRAEEPPKALRYAWAVDGDWRTVQVTVRQDHESVMPSSAITHRQSSPVWQHATLSRCSHSTLMGPTSLPSANATMLSERCSDGFLDCDQSCSTPHMRPQPGRSSGNG